MINLPTFNNENEKREWILQKEGEISPIPNCYNAVREVVVFG